jgi:hypothetical protein
MATLTKEQRGRSASEASQGIILGPLQRYNHQVMNTRILTLCDLVSNEFK